MESGLCTRCGCFMSLHSSGYCAWCPAQLHAKVDELEAKVRDAESVRDAMFQRAASMGPQR